MNFDQFMRRRYFPAVIIATILYFGTHIVVAVIRGKL